MDKDDGDQAMNEPIKGSDLFIDSMVVTARLIVLRSNTNPFDFEEIACCHLDAAYEGANELSATGKHDVWQACINAGADIETVYNEFVELKALEELITFYWSPKQWAEGVTFINDEHMMEWCQQEAVSCGAIQTINSWPCCFIEWDQALAHFKSDYRAVEFDGATFWIRA